MILKNLESQPKGFRHFSEKEGGIQSIWSGQREEEYGYFKASSFLYPSMWKERENQEKEQKRGTDILKAEVDVLLSVHKTLYFILENNWTAIILVIISSVRTIMNNLSQITKNM